jgi:uncharacterized protein (TIGR03083 family)
MTDSTWDFRSAASKGRLLAALRRASDELLDLAADPADWHSPTACTGWELRDMVGHLVDATESYGAGIEAARRADPIEPAVGRDGMAAAVDAAARAFRDVPQHDLLARLREANDSLLAEFDSLTEEEWSTLMVPEPYLGRLPALAIVTGLLGGYVVHGWDVREGRGLPHAVDADAADLLVPFTFALWSATADTGRVTTPFTVGIRTTGRNGGDIRAEVSVDGVHFAPGDLAGCDAVLMLDPGTLVLTAYGRVNAGTVHGDPQRLAEFRNLFVPI